MTSDEAGSGRDPPRTLPIVLISVADGLAWSSTLRAFMLEHPAT